MLYGRGARESSEEVITKRRVQALAAQLSADYKAFCGRSPTTTLPLSKITLRACGGNAAGAAMATPVATSSAWDNIVASSSLRRVNAADYHGRSQQARPPLPFFAAMCDFCKATSRSAASRWLIPAVPSLSESTHDVAMSFCVT